MNKMHQRTMHHTGDATSPSASRHHFSPIRTPLAQAISSALLVLGAMSAVAHADDTISAGSTSADIYYSHASDTNIVINSGGSIIGSAYGISNDGTLGALVNHGFISGGSEGVTNGLSITSLVNTGTIQATAYDGIYNQGTIDTINNSGLIQSANWGIYNSGSPVGTIGTLINSGTISGGAGDGVSNAGIISVLRNSGTITSNGSGGSTAGVFNSGTIGALSNSGTISGYTGVFNAASGTMSALTNTGLISGSIYALNFAGGVVTNLTNTGTIAGNIVNSANGSSALTIAGGSGSTFGTLTGYNGAIGSFVSNTDLVFTGNQLLNDAVSVNSGSGTLTNNGILQVNNHITLTGNYLQSAAATLAIGVSSGAGTSGVASDNGYGRLVVLGDAIVEAGSSVVLKKVTTYGYAAGQRYVVIQASGSNTNYHYTTLNYNGTGYSATGSLADEIINGTTYHDLVLTIDGLRNATPATTNNANSVLNGLYAYTGVNQSLLNVYNPALAITDTAEANRAGAQLSPAAVTSASVQASAVAQQAVTGVANSRLDGLRLAQGGNSGVATGETLRNVTPWGQVFGGKASQSARDAVSGYHANYRGILLGADAQVGDAVRAGALVSAAKTSLASDGDNTGSSGSVNSYGLSAYATYWGTPWYVNVVAGVARQQYSTERAISYTGFSGTAYGSFNGVQLSTSVQAGYPLSLDGWSPGLTLTPLAGLSYSTLRQNGYRETGGSGAALVVNGATSNSLKSEFGAKLENTVETTYGKLSPSVQLGWRHEFNSDATQIGASFAADSTGTTAFVTRGAKPVSDLGVLNLAATLVRTNNLSLTAKYTLEAGGGYTAQTASLQARWQY